MTAGYLSVPGKDDYPIKAWTEGTRGDVTLALIIDHTGIISNCNVVSGSGSGDLDDASCAYAIARWQFKPALDFDGNTTKGRIEKDLKWRAPINVVEDDVEEDDFASVTVEKNFFRDPGMAIVELNLAKSGQIDECKIKFEGLASAVEAISVGVEDVCADMLDSSTKFEPFLDSAGQPASKKILIEITLKHPSSGDKTD